jgi:hypothetical protein
MIGNFKPNKIKNEFWTSNIFTSDSTEGFNSFLKNNYCFIDVMDINDKLYYHTFNKHSTNLECEVPIYNQIIQQEAINLHKLTLLIKTNGGDVLDLNTDAVNCTFPDNEFPFELLDENTIKCSLLGQRKPSA